MKYPTRLHIFFRFLKNKWSIVHLGNSFNHLSVVVFFKSKLVGISYAILCAGNERAPRRPGAGLRADEIVAVVAGEVVVVDGEEAGDSDQRTTRTGAGLHV